VIVLNDKYADQQVMLKSHAVNPFNQWADWYGTDGEAVVTFRTMKEHLWDRWQSDCVSISHDDCDHGDSWDERTEQDPETGTSRFKDCDSERVVEHERFDPTNVQAPGIYLDGTHYDDADKVDESYTIIVPYPFLSPELCQEWIKKLNEQYDRQFELDIDEDQRKRAGGLEATGMNRVKLSEKSSSDDACTDTVEGGSR
jgi:hypothetical protein